MIYWKDHYEHQTTSKFLAFVLTSRVFMLYSTRLILQSISSVDPELGTEIKPFIKYIDRMLKKYMNDKTSNAKQDEAMLEKEIEEMEAQLVNMKSEPTVPSTPLEDKMDIDVNPSWYLYEDWSPCPIGTLPNGKVPCLDMSFYMQEK